MPHALLVYNIVGLAMSDKKVKTIKDRLVDTLLPLAVWVQQKALGSLFTSEAWHQVAISFVPPPDSLSSNIIEGCEAQGIYVGYATEALHSPSRRRKLRRYAQHRFSRMLRNDHRLRSGLSVIVDYLSRWRRDLEASGYEADPTRINKLTDIQVKIRRELDVLSRNTIIIDQWLPPEEVLDPRFYAAIMKDRGRQGYAYEVIKLIQEFALYARALKMQRLTPNSHLFALLGFDRQRLYAPETCVIEFLERLISILGIKIGTMPQTEQVRLNWEKIGEIAKWAIRRELPKTVLGKGYSVRDKKEISLDKPVGQGRTLKDILLDYKVAEQLEKYEERMVLESSLQLLPPAERDDAKFFLDPDNKGKSPQELRRELGNKEYETKQRGFERAVKRLANLKKEGKLPT